MVCEVVVRHAQLNCPVCRRRPVAVTICAPAAQADVAEGLEPLRAHVLFSCLALLRPEMLTCSAVLSSATSGLELGAGRVEGFAADTVGQRAHAALDRRSAATQLPLCAQKAWSSVGNRQWPLMSWPGVPRTQHAEMPAPASNRRNSYFGAATLHGVESWSLGGCAGHAERGVRQ